MGNSKSPSLFLSVPLLTSKPILQRMHSPSQSSFFSIFSMFIFFILNHLQTSSWAQTVEYQDCTTRKIQCGNLKDIGYPFYGGNRPEYCGHPGFELNCNDDHLEISIMSQMSPKFYVIDINDTSHTLTLAREDYYYNYCPSTFINTAINLALFNYTQRDANIMFHYGCFPANLCPFQCIVNGEAAGGYFSIPNIASGFDDSQAVKCTHAVIVPVYRSAFAHNEEPGQNVTITTVRQALENGFELEWYAENEFCYDECHGTSGECGYNWDEDKPACYHPEGGKHSNAKGPEEVEKHSKATRLAIGISAGVVAALLLVCCSFFILRRKRLISYAESKEISAAQNGLPPSNGLFSSNGSTTTTASNSQSIPSYASSKSDLESATYFGLKVFSYAELEQATDNFAESRELGDGGFGVVYYGELPDGRPVAVKRLFENNFKRVGQFNNEINILVHLRHRNLVTLYGFSSRRSRELILVYEYIPNGTVADHLHGKLSESSLLTWPIRLNIAIETADALAYLHASDVIHRDIKTTNILLDKNFKVKVADFGLSRLFPNDATHVSTAPQGTPGYVDPEYYQVYRLTEKSDVYSFGVVLIELISSKEAVDPFRQRLDVNLANMAIDRIQNQALHELVDPRLGFDDDRAVRDMIKLVAELAFRCLQQEKDLRPSMVEVVEVLRGIQKKMSSTEKQVVMDIKEDDVVGLLKNVPSPLSPETGRV